MWRTNGLGGSPSQGNTANIVQSTYHPDQPTEFGKDNRCDDTPGAFNRDGNVVGSDLGLWRSAFGITNNGDVNGDLDTDGGDFLAWQQHCTGNLSHSFSAAAANPNR